MALPNVARQYSLAVFIDIVFGDIPVTAVAVALAELPQGSVITNINAFVVTAFAGSGNYDADFGDVTDPNEYSPTIVELDAPGIPTNTVAVSGFKTTSSEPDLNITPVFTTVPTAGAARLLVEYVTSGRNNENRG